MGDDDFKNAVREDLAELKDGVKELRDCVIGDGEKGLVPRVVKIERFHTVVVWLVATVLASALAAAGSWGFSKIVERPANAQVVTQGK